MIKKEGGKKGRKGRKEEGRKEVMMTDQKLLWVKQRSSSSDRKLKSRFAQKIGNDAVFWAL